MADPSTNTPKPVVKSKTVWINLIIAILAFIVMGAGAPEMKAWLSANAEWAIGIISILNLVLRLLTTSPLGATEDQ